MTANNHGTTDPDAGHSVNEVGTHGHGGAGDHTAGGAPVAHHFNNMLQQQATVRFGMWLFLVTEVLFFGGGLCAYTVYRVLYPADFAAGSAALNVGIASVNTFLLLTSSLTVTLAIRSCYTNSKSGLKFWLGMTIILGTVFLGLKAREYHLDYEEGLIPTGAETLVELPPDVSVPHYMRDGTVQPQPHKEPVLVTRPVFGQNVEKVLRKEGFTDKDLAGVNLARVQLFFIFYYVLTGLHVIHMIIGVGLLGWQFTMAHFDFFKYKERYVYVEVMSLYWHFVDMVWMFLLPLLYFAGPHNLEQAKNQFLLAIGLASGGHHS